MPRPARDDPLPRAPPRRCTPRQYTRATGCQPAPKRWHPAGLGQHGGGEGPGVIRGISQRHPPPAGTGEADPAGDAGHGMPQSGPMCELGRGQAASRPSALDGKFAGKPWRPTAWVLPRAGSARAPRPRRSPRDAAQPAAMVALWPCQRRWRWGRSREMSQGAPGRAERRGRLPRPGGARDCAPARGLAPPPACRVSVLRLPWPITFRLELPPQPANAPSCSRMKRARPAPADLGLVAGRCTRPARASLRSASAARAACGQGTA